MLRILFIILSVLAAVLAVLLDQPLLYALAGALLIAALVMVLSGMRRRPARRTERGTERGPERRPARRAPEPAAPVAEEAAGEDDLASLGILEIRPKERAVARRSGPAADRPAEGGRERPREDLLDAERAGGEVEAARPVENGAVPPPSGGSVTVRKKTPSVQAVDEAMASRAVLIPYLQSARTALDAQTVCLLRQDEMVLQYHIEAIVSQNAYARSLGFFSTRVPLVSANDEHRDVVVRRVGEHDLAPGNLGYYREPIAVKSIVLAPIQLDPSGPVHFLVADSMQEGHFADRNRQALLVEFGRLLTKLMGNSGSDQLPGSSEARRENIELVLAEEVDGVRPRRDIIADEMIRARRAGRSLALALVYLNEAELRAEEGGRTLANAEKALEKEIRRSVDGGRVERMGELTFGVFLQAEPMEVESWAVALQQHLAASTGPLEGGISIGIAFLGDRHEDPDDFRADATEALREAYESGTCTIIE